MDLWGSLEGAGAEHHSLCSGGKQVYELVKVLALVHEVTGVVWKFWREVLSEL